MLSSTETATTVDRHWPHEATLLTCVVKLAAVKLRTYPYADCAFLYNGRNDLEMSLSTRRVQLLLDGLYDFYLLWRHDSGHLRDN
jgi:hypothetical protein